MYVCCVIRVCAYARMSARSVMYVVYIRDERYVRYVRMMSMNVDYV